LLILYQFHLVFSYINRTNTELNRFLDALRYSDFSQRFNMPQQGAGFKELGDTMTAIMQRAFSARSEKEVELRHLKALVEHVPVPLITLEDDGKITLCNNSARRLFGTHAVARLEDLNKFGDAFAASIQALVPGQRQLVNFEMENMTRMLAAQTTQVIQSGRQRKLISLQDIQSELDKTQIKAWQDLVSVLTHEIMNSITPVTSLATTAVALADDARTQVSARAPEFEEVIESLEDVSSAMQTVANRSDGLMNFVTSYRRLTKLPPADKKEVDLSEFLARVHRLVEHSWQQHNISLAINVEPPGLSARIDNAMVEQLLLNLLKNAEQAILSVHDSKTKNVSIGVSLNTRGHIEIVVEDSGPGIPKDISEQVFVPFFTTKREGSGVGLALTRQVMMAHGGDVRLSDSDLGGARFVLTF
ncbi:MAG: ATP-binding protein, partial [Pseudomonadota bacterium]